MDSSEGNDDNLPYRITPSRMDTSGQFPSRRRGHDRPNYQPYRTNPDLNSTANASVSVIGSLPLYSPQKAVKHIKNPFEHARLIKDRLSQPVCSPSLFKKAISPINKSPSFTWNIEDISMLRPAEIDENPSQEFASWYSPDTESQAQEAIDRFFSSMSHETLESPAVNRQGLSCNASSQTSLSFPPFLPDGVEMDLKALAQPFAGSLDESMNSSTCSARRKILSIDIKSESDSDDSTMDSYDSDKESVHPVHAATPLRRPMISPDVSPIVSYNEMDNENESLASNNVSMFENGNSLSR